MKQFFTLNLDFAGFFTSSLCAVHCAALPLLIGFGLIGTEWMNHFWLEVFFISFSLLFAFQSLYKNYKNVHKQLYPMILAALGFTMFFIALQFHGVFEIIGTSMAGICIAIAHVMNWRLVRSLKMERSRN